ncbi:hypothetical protein ACWCXB_31185 [Streptomyces sp. NPDC001514]
MFERRRATENDDLAHIMRRFFREVNYLKPSEIALQYAKRLHESDLEQLLAKKRTEPGAKYYVGLSCETKDFETLTKRTSLIANSLLLSHGHEGTYHEFEQTSDNRESANRVDTISAYGGNDYLTAGTGLGVQCPEIEVVGNWIIEARELLCSGLVWYLPSYARATHRLRADSGVEPDVSLARLARGPDPVDYLIRDRCAIDASGAEAMKGRLVRPILRIDLPYVDGVSLRDFSKITVGEFDGYRELRNYLRGVLLDLDEAMDATQADLELTKIGLEIEGHILETASKMRTLKQKKLIASLGAGLGTVSAALVAVSGSVLEKALPVLGLSGGIWGLVNSMSDHRAKDLTQGKWYYVWLLGEARKG